ncbi:acylglycerol kinase, mitochondrial isoform X1 [Agrilus planipennis]|uniref:Acylglycerol kinase, mitochondrial n=1 Tax=Agrilus planipennis TaxID=224129 RepID=A0A1W4XH92_AGRPL|nr:acylglycerol kinase, mitochondrial isoform X2 [Agrilus planipennis]XP_025834828.1 acylglycerol kinase, mitochondrial isoform X1 [Agrilus planipennis]
MSVIIKFLKGVRNHWKKSTLGAVCFVYGCNYAKNAYDTNLLMREYCMKALEYGKEPISKDSKPRNITIILNPNANKRKAHKRFQKHCAPILYVAGICVDVIQTESEGHAKRLMEELKNTDAIVVAGGDGTLSEVVSGLMRRLEDVQTDAVPLGILPLGSHNTVGKTLFPGDGDLKDVKSLADASLAVVEACTKPVDVMKIEVTDKTENSGKPIYAVSCLEWGAFRDAEARKDKYWYFGPLRSYITYLVNGFKNDLNWDCKATINYTLPCKGCSNCQAKPNENRRWYHRFMPYKERVAELTTVANDECQEIHEKEISTVDFSLFTSNIVANVDHAKSNDEPAKLSLTLGPKTVDYTNFVSQGWKSEKGFGRNYSEVIEAKQIEIIPKSNQQHGKEFWYSIDKEDYEVKPIKITLMPRALRMFCRKSDIELVQ